MNIVFIYQCVSHHIFMIYISSMFSFNINLNTSEILNKDSLVEKHANI